MAKTRQGTETSASLSAEKERVQRELQEMQDRYASMAKDFQRQKDEFAADMERIREENDRKEQERMRRIRDAEAKRERDDKLLRQMKLAVEVSRH